MNIPKIGFRSYGGWNDEVGSCFIRETNDIVQVQNKYADVVSGSFSNAENLIKNNVIYTSFKANIDALRPPR